MVVIIVTQPDANGVSFVVLYPRITPKKKRLVPTKDLKEVLVGPHELQTTKLGTYMTKDEEETWSPYLGKISTYLSGTL